MSDYFYTPSMQTYLREQYPNGGPILSVVVGEGAYSQPRLNNLPRAAYTHVEVGVIGKDGLWHTSKLAAYVPSVADDDDTVASITVDELATLRSALTAAFGEPSACGGSSWPEVPA